jgi:hypothetical protein
MLGSIGLLTSTETEELVAALNEILLMLPLKF